MYTALQLRIGTRRHVYLVNVDEKFVNVVGALSTDKVVRDLAAYGSAALSDHDA